MPSSDAYDFRRPNRFSREHVRALQIVNETFARQLATVLSTTLRVVSQASVTSVGQTTYDEYVASVPNPSLLAVLSFDELPGQGVFQLPMDIVMGVVDRLLGGPGGGNQPSRALSDIETGLVRRLVQRIVLELTYSFESLDLVVHPKVVNLESDAQFMQLAPPAEPVILSRFDIRIGDQQAVATLCLPFATLQPALDKVGARTSTPRTGADSLAARQVEQRLYAVPVEVTVAFREVSLTSSEVLALAVGDVLPLRHPVAEPLGVSADGIRVAAAVPGSQGQRLACQVVPG
ncbi:flagellar motor switch protein FliM [Oryzihumus sp.]|jgi:flagellar motor switch protein FliM|uniref:flagellar motor switch protein FliM n=1 Tax=Oryzihumus sp. TaxID=1968903 RepID=UPI002ED8DB75